MTAPQSASDALVGPAFVRTMAAYNAEMNRRIYAAAQRLPEPERRLPRGAFWGSIHGTLCHLLWGDQMWMSRFDGWAKPTVSQKDSPALIDDFGELARRAHRRRCANFKLGGARAARSGLRRSMSGSACPSTGSCDSRAACW